MPVITLKFKERTIQDYPLAIGQSCSIGRKSSNDIVIDNMAVSGTHARIEAVASTFVIRDLDSTNGTFVNKKKVSMYNLRHLDHILIGKHTLIFDLTDTIPKGDHLEFPEDADKTMYLDTNEYRELMKAVQHENSSEHEPPPPAATAQPDTQNAPSLLRRIFEKLFGQT